MTDTKPEALRLAEIFDYDKTTGDLHWKVPAGNGRIKAGTKAGYPTKCGGVKVMYKKKGYFAHHVVWLLHTGSLPEEFIDHINGNRSDNRIENLRLCNQSQNMQNLCKTAASASGLRGVQKYRNSKWASSIIVKGKKTWLGVFDTKEAAFLAYTQAKKKFHTFNPELRNECSDQSIR
jgi:hypothetical protein